MKRCLVGLALIVPALALIYFTLQPQANTSSPQPLFHFYVVTFMSFAAAVVSILLTTLLGTQAQARHTLAALAFCRRVVEAHHGQIRVDEAPGGGSDFSFWLPRQA
jgi:predicted membrane-bound dolichyl-phosphate-mannose-protein mannosyltransferase